ncbi:hypothetical protein [Bdellovibrio sp. NC01]|uniref:hypothetical protein n=1 Tax=Bdellovibrio sp. NC01 TaxID=2220073 RepID=UPI001FEF0FA0|nr:hypothetical protein [Bdellovibrio sp. NC01]
MKNLSLLTLAVILTAASLTYAKDIDKSGQQQAPASKKEYCTQGTDPNYYKSLIYNYQNRLSFLNAGGIGNGGVCWWHSMFTRNATYIAVYRPELPRASADRAKRIIDAIIANDAVVEIPGYKNLYEFSIDYHQQIQSALNRWQISEGIAFGWLRGLSGKTRVAPDVLKSMMDELYQEVRSGRIAYQKLQIPGIMAHAWLVVDMWKTNLGYDFEVVDSNTREVYKVHYQKGMTHLNEYNSVPYTGRNSANYSSYTSAKKNYCKLGINSENKPQLQQNYAGN